MTAFKFLKKSLIFFVVFILAFVFINPDNVYAEETINKDISKKLSVSYEITENDNILVNMDVNFTNQYKYKQYLKDYWINVGEAFPRNIVLTSSLETKIEYVVSQMGEGRGIKVIFPDITLNTNDSISIQIQYELPHFVRKIGQLYLVDIPSFLTSSTKIEAINVKFPREKGNIIYSSYTNYTTSQDENYIYMNIETFEPFSPLIIIGESQNYNFTLTQSYSNNGGTVHRVTLPLPHNSCTQQNVINNTSTVPQTFSKDEFGNNWATYVIPEYGSLIINYSAQIAKFHTNGCNSEEIKPSFQNLKFSFNNSPLIWDYINKNIISNDELAKLNKNEIASLFYNYIIPRVVIAEDSQIPADNIDNILLLLEKISNEPPLYISPKDLNVILFTLLSQAQIETVMDWGVLYPYYMDTIKVTPYVWITYWDEEGKAHTLDIVFQKLNKTSGFDKQMLDKVLIYRTNDPFSNNIGWDLYQNVSVFLANEKTEVNNQLSSKLSFTDKLKSGTENNGTLYISNTGNSILIISDIQSNSKNVNITFQDDINSIIIFPGQTSPVSIKLKSSKALYNSKTNVVFNFIGTDLGNNSFFISQEESIKLNLSLGLLALSILLTIILLSPLLYMFYSFKQKRTNPYKIVDHTKNSPLYNIPFIYMKLKNNMIKLLNKIKKKNNNES